MEIYNAVEIYLRSLSNRNIRQSTQCAYATDINQFVCILQLSDTDTLSYESIHVYLASLLASDISPSTVEKKRVEICTFIRWLNDEGIVDLPELSKRVKRIKLDKTPPRCLSEDELRRFLDAAETLHHDSKLCKLRDTTILHVMADTGLRKSEVLAMTLDALDLAHRTITVSAESKGRRSRVVAFTPDTLRRLRGYLRERSGINCNSVWVNIYGERISDMVIRLAVRRSARAAGLLNVHPHTLRHSFATRAIHKGLGLTSLQKLLGHAKLQTTSLYLHIDDNEAIEDYEKCFG